VGEAVEEKFFIEARKVTVDGDREELVGESGCGSCRPRGRRVWP
jgi:hypothetical protein